MADDKPMDRRRFFRVGLAELFKPLGQAVAPLEEVARQLGKLEEPYRPAPRPLEIRRALNTVSRGQLPQPPVDDEGQSYWLRPPGARVEHEFTSICSRCGNCVHACPVHAIQLDHSGARGEGVPFIDPEKASCEMCEELACMNQCPSSALQVVAREEIDMGIAQWDASTCLRTAVGEQCSMCVDHCPVGPAAIHVSENTIVVDADHCTGCGTCQNNCPTTPRSIRITPKSKRDRDLPTD